MTGDFDAIVLGAGLAGLNAARTLGAAGKKTLVIEARNRAGGRVLTVRDAATDYPIELGPEWVGASGHLRELLNSINADVRATRGSHVVRKSGSLLARENFDETMEIMERISVLLDRSADLTLTEALRACCPEAEFSESRESLLNYVRGFHAADPDRVSARWLLEVEDNEPASASEGHALAGLDWAIDALRTQLASCVALQLNAVATEVAWDAERVRVRATIDGQETREFTAKKLICTLPLAVLKASAGEAGSVRFTPPLTSKRSALELLDTGPVVKIVLVFDDSFWTRVDGLRKVSFIQHHGQPIPTWWTTYPVDSPVLTGWVAGPLTQSLGGKRGDELLAAALDSLASALGVSVGTVRERLRGWHTHDWSQDPYARGGYSYVLSGGTGAYLELARPVANTLFFAGEATAGSGHNATMEGAMQSGLRAAEELLACS